MDPVAPLISPPFKYSAATAKEMRKIDPIRGTHAYWSTTPLPPSRWESNCSNPPFSGFEVYFFSTLQAWPNEFYSQIRIPWFRSFEALYFFRVFFPQLPQEIYACDKNAFKIISLGQVDELYQHGEIYLLTRRAFYYNPFRWKFIKSLCRYCAHGDIIRSTFKNLGGKSLCREWLLPTPLYLYLYDDRGASHWGAQSGQKIQVSQKF